MCLFGLELLLNSKDYDKSRNNVKKKETNRTKNKTKIEPKKKIKWKEMNDFFLSKAGWGSYLLYIK